MGALFITAVVVFIIGIILTIALVVPSYKTVDSNYVGLDFDSTAMTLDESKVYDSGRYFIGVSHHFITFRTDQQSLNFSQVPTRTKDGLAIRITVSFQYKLVTTLDALLNIVYLFPDGSQEATYITLCRNVFRDTTARYEVFQFVNNRTDIEQDLKTSTSNSLSQYGASVQNFQLVDIIYPSNFQDAISETQNAIQNIQTAQFTLTKAQQQVQGLIDQATTAQQVILNQASIDASNILAAANGISASITQRISALQVSLKSFQMNANITNVTNLITYQWINAVNILQAKLYNNVAIRLDLPNKIKCLYNKLYC